MYLLQRGGKALTSYSMNFLRIQNLISISRLFRLENKYKGQRCFILGNGPSLIKTDLTLLKNEFTFGSNGIYTLFEKLGFPTNFYLAIDKQFIERNIKAINQINTQRFHLLEHRSVINFDHQVIFLRQQDNVHFWKNPIQKIYISGSVTYASIQLAIFMGFNPIILVGVDHSYSVTSSNKEKAKPVLFNGNHQDHFNPNYLKAGDTWVPPNLEKIELGYRIAKFECERSGKEILDATIGGKLDLFPKVEFNSLF